MNSVSVDGKLPLSLFDDYNDWYIFDPQGEILAMSPPTYSL